MKHLSDSQLEAELLAKSAAERKLTLEVIELLEEMDRRKIYLTRGYSSLIEYCVKELKYSESSAYRRIAAMRVAREVPETKKKLESGSLNLATVAQAQSFFRAEAAEKKPLSTEAKRDVLANLDGKSYRQTEKFLAELSPERKAKDKVRASGNGQQLLTLTISKELIEKLEEVRNRLSHKVPGGEYSKVLEHLLDQELNKLAPRNLKLANKRSAAPTPVPHETLVAEKYNGSSKKRLTKRAGASLNVAGEEQRSRYILRDVEREVWVRSEGQCCYVDEDTKRRCSAKRYLEIDHIWPRSRGGKSVTENLQLLCSAHNRLKSDWPLSLQLNPAPIPGKTAHLK